MGAGARAESSNGKEAGRLASFATSRTRGPGRWRRMPIQSTPLPSSRILGVDPGLQVTGYAVLEAAAAGPRVCEAGVIRSAGGRGTPDMAVRVLALYNGIVGVLDQFRPE